MVENQAIRPPGRERLVADARSSLRQKPRCVSGYI